MRISTVSRGLAGMLILLSLTMSGQLALGQVPVLPTSATQPGHEERVKTAQELKELKWGMFIHWSFSTFTNPKAEWARGIKDVAFFAATDADTDQWARTAKEAEMGYILFVTKHHDGFCLWDTQTTERKVTRAPLGRDVLAELRKSCDKYGIKLALHFSEGEFKDHKDYHPGGYTPEMKKAQIKELLTQYGPIAYVWFDHAQGDGGLSHEETTAWCHQWQPATLVGYNSGPKSGEIDIRERGSSGPLDPNAGYLIAEFSYPILPDRMFHSKWFYSLDDEDTPSHSPKKLYRDYQRGVRHGTLFTIALGPDHHGKLRKLDVETLREVGAMIRNPPRPPMPPPVSQGKPATASSAWNASYDAAKAFDGDEFTRWSAAKGITNGWLEVDLQEDVLIDRAVIVEVEFERVEEYAIEYRSGEEWKEMVRGTTIGRDESVTFPPVSARRVRLNIIRARDVPTIWEFQLFQSKSKEDAMQEEVQIELGEPVTVALAPPEVRGWGPYQFPSLFRLPDRRIQLSFHLEADSAATYGLPPARAVSADEGKTWTLLPREPVGDGAMIAWGSGPLSLPNGDRLNVKQLRSKPLGEVTLPATPFATYRSYGRDGSVYRLEDLPEAYRAGWMQYRLPAGATEWVEDQATVNLPGQVRKVIDGALVFPWFQQMFLAPDSSVWAVNYGKRIEDGRYQQTVCLFILRSTDQGRTWDLWSEVPYRGDPAADPKAAEREGFTEPTVNFRPDGSVFCLLRTTDGSGPGPLYWIRSTDSGRTWTKPAVFDDLGVWPQMQTLENGVTLAVYGRPGLYVRATSDPAALRWGERVAVVPPGKITQDTCSYGALLALEDGEALVAYSNFNLHDADGKRCKGIQVRTVRTSRGNR